MKVLGMVASQRRLGNTEILVKEALMGAGEEGAVVEILRLTDYQILPCDGLAPCLYSERGCNLTDDFNFLLGKINESDGLILGTPCYAMEAAAILKQFIDRTVLSVGRSQVRERPAAILIPYGGRGYTTYAFVQPNILLLRLGMRVIDRALILAQGVGEVVLDERALNRAHEVGKAVAQAIKTGDASYRGEPGICHDRNIRILRDNETVECSTCLIRGKIRVIFNEEEVKRSIWTEENFYYSGLWRFFDFVFGEHYFGNLKSYLVTWQ